MGPGERRAELELVDRGAGEDRAGPRGEGGDATIGRVGL